MDSEALPLGWAWATLGDITDRPDSTSPAQAFVSDAHFHYVDLSAIKGGRIVSPQSLLPSAAPSRARQVIHAGDTLFSGVRVYLENIAFVGDALEGQIASTAFSVLRPKPGIDPRYVYWLTRQPTFIRAMVDAQRGNSPPAVQDDDVRSARIAVAPSPEQRRIASGIEKLIEELDEAEAALARAKAGVEQFRASLLHAACTGQLTAVWRQANPPTETGADLLRRILAERRANWERAERARLKAKSTPPKGDAWKARYVEPVFPDLKDTVQTLPPGWAWSSLDQLLSTMTSGSRAWMPYYGRGTCIFLMAQNVKPDRLDLTFKQLVDPPEADAERERTRIQQNDILLTIVGAKTGDACHVNVPLYEHYVCQSVALLRPVIEEIASYVTKYLSSPLDGRNVLNRMAYGAGRPHLNFEQLKAMPIPLPPQSELQEIVAIFDSENPHAFELIKFELGDFDTAQLRQAILHAAFTGRLVPQNPDDELAETLLARIRATAAPARRARRRALPEICA